MKNIRISHLLLISIAVFVISSCSSLKEPELVSVEIVDLSRTAGEGLLKVNLTYSNPNNKLLTIKRVSVDGLINQKSVGKYTLPKRGKIGKKSEETIEATFKFNPDNIYSGFLSKQFGAIGSKRVRISLAGETEFIKEDASMIIPLDYSEVYKLP